MSPVTVGRSRPSPPGCSPRAPVSLRSRPATPNPSPCRQSATAKASLVADRRPSLRPLLLDMRRRAPTFRRQVMRLVGQPDLVVTVGVWHMPTAGASGPVLA